MDPRLTRLLVITFLATLAEIVTGRGIYFYTEYRLAFTERQNLLLGLGMGLAYAVSAWTSHASSKRLGMKRQLVLACCGVLLCDAVLLIRPTGAVLVVATLAKAYCNMAKWPVIESYISAGRNPRQTAEALGRFNVAWAVPIPLGIAATGPIVEWWPPGLFLLAAVIEVVELWLLRPLERQPVHLPDDHPEHLPASQLRRYGALLVSGRWAQLGNAIGLMLLSPLLPAIFRDLGFTVIAATAASSLLDWARVAVFSVLRRSERWHGRMYLMAWLALLLPVSVTLVMLTADVYRRLVRDAHGGLGLEPDAFLMICPIATLLVVAGTCLLGVTGGGAYFTALYYAMVVKRASVEGGAVHEGLGALGMTIGPAAGLGAKTLGRVLGVPVLGTLLGVVPLFGALSAAALWPLLRLRREEREERAAETPVSLASRAEERPS